MKLMETMIKMTSIKILRQRIEYKYNAISNTSDLKFTLKTYPFEFQRLEEAFIGQ